MKKTLGGIILLIVILALGYTFRHQIKSTFLGNRNSIPPTETSTSSSVSENVPQPSPTISDIVSTGSGAKGNFLIGPTGMTLYVFDKDTTGTKSSPAVSNCTGSCVGIWPPYTVSGIPTSLPANVGTITRSDDGTTQLTYKGRPLYYYSSDSQPGDAKGDGFGGIWHIVKP